MSNKIIPKGRKNLPQQLINFGRHLIYSEGTKTEPNYVENIKKLIAKKYNVHPNDVEIVKGNKKSNNTIHLVNDALKDVKKRLKNNEIINHVWIFFDKDDFPIEDFNEACRKLERINNSKDKNDDGFNYETKTDITYHACYSNEAFELWLCLYFGYIHAALGRKQLIEYLDDKLTPYGYEYGKNIENIHDILECVGGKLEKAIIYAKKLEVNINKNPSTTVHNFIEYFKPYFKS